MADPRLAPYTAPVSAPVTESESHPPYGRVVVIWVLVLAALFAFQRYFT